MPRLPGSAAGSGMGGFLSGAGGALEEKLTSVGGSLLDTKFKHDMDMDRLDKQLEARAEENARSDDNAMMRTIFGTGDLELIDKWVHHGQGHSVPSIAKKYQDWDSVVHPSAEKQSKARGYINTLMTADDASERVTAKTNLEEIRASVHNPKTLTMIDQALAQKDLGTMLLGNEMLITYEEYIPTDTHGRLVEMLKHSPGAVVNIIPTIITDRNARLSLYQQILDDDNRSQMMEAYGPDMIEWVRKEMKRLMNIPPNGDNGDNDDTPPPLPPDPALIGKTKEFLKTYPLWVSQVGSNTVPTDEDVIQFINSSEFEKVREEILSPSATGDSSMTEKILGVGGKIAERVTGGSGPDKKLNQYVGGKAWKDTNNPGSVLRFRYNKESGEYEVRDAPRSKADVYPDWQSISTEQFNEMINNLVQWSR
jgi:hypothetical protein